MAWKTLCSEMEFLTQYPMVGQAISDSSSSIPGYLFGEINAITYIDFGRNCKPLVNFLASKLQASTPFVSLKVFKLLIFLVKNGHSEIIEEVKCHEVDFKAALGFYGKEDDFHGKTYYENIRKMAKELLEYVYSEDREINAVNPIQRQPELTGYGSNAGLNKMTGFGHTMKNQKSMSAIVSGGLSNFVEKLLTTNEHENILEEVCHIGDSLPQYKPLIIEKNHADQDFAVSPPVVCNAVVKRQKHRVHKPGRPGGGWDDSDEEEEDAQALATSDKSKTSSNSMDSTELSKTDIKDYADDCTEEKRIVEEFVINEDLRTITFENIREICRKCSTMNSQKVLSLLVDKMADKEFNIQLRAVLFMEFLIYHDATDVETMAEIITVPLKSFQEKNDVSPVAKTKCKKILLILQTFQKIQRLQNNEKGIVHRE